MISLQCFSAISKHIFQYQNDSSYIPLMTIFGGKIQMIPKNSCHHHRLIIHPDRNCCFLFAFFPGSLLIHAHTCFHQSMKVIVRLFSFLLLHLSSSHLEARRHRELFITYKQNFCLYLVYNTGRDPGLHVHQGGPTNKTYL